MGKYIRKAKTAGEVAVMEVSQSSLGVRTRAKTLALQRLQKSSTSPATVASAPVTEDGSYLQLRSRRLEKPPIMVHHHDSKRQKQQQQQQGSKKESCGQNPNPNSNSRVRVGSGSGSAAEKKKEGEIGREEIVQENNGNDNTNNCSNNNNNESKDFGGVEASFGENVLDIEARERSARESTPCSLIRDPESIRTPGSTTRPTSSAETNQRVQNSTRRHIPTAQEMDEFFAVAEEEQQRQFIEKYNFDPVNDKPLPGRYEWEKVDP
ncbi:Cyclin-dependent kinase inhibitor domain - like 4 [Theobroma cacao]|uniref:Cyclin-dependent kinase inhibitor 5 n=1 Tax=Theobroma cacao TaxID=3641 RepID=A0AB32V9H4_THECC|nr:PREDICTED: cyclin-dependent kinase inhibitor 5 [Theobroma cacao]WRX21158.1 Cyclin-dependent kinase inhibitor domain - like 4 [Theobroma cacao]